MIRVATYQAAPKQDLDARKKQVSRIVAKTHSKKIDFLCMPEGFLTGYYQEEKLAWKNSLQVGSKDFEEWLTLFKNTDATIIVGFNERAGKQLFDSAAIIEKGTLIGIQRKHFLYHSYFSSNSAFSVFESKGISFGVTICLDTNYFEPARILALQGAAILFVPMCNKVALDHPFATRPPYYSHFVARSHENRLWLVAADWVHPNDGALICPGHSVIYDPDGKEITRCREMSEDLIRIDIALDRLYSEKGRRVRGSIPLFQKIAHAVLYTQTR